MRDGNEIIAAAGAGAVTGAVAPFMLPLGWAGDFVDGAIGGGVNQLLLNWLCGCQLMQGVFEAAGEGAAWGGAFGAAGRSARKMAKPLREAAGQAIEDFGGTWGRKARQVFDDATAPLRQAVGECFNSFSTETPVATEEGTQAISTLDIGDQILAWDEATGETGYYTVTATLVHNDPLMVYLTIVSPELAEGGEIVQTTPEHPFYVVERSEWSAYLSVGKWVDAGDLHVGDTLRKAGGSLGIVGEVNVVVAAQVMYNLTVDQAHTFFVGDGQWLVHNADCPIDVFAFGNSTKPRSPRPGDFSFESADPSQRIPGQVPPSPHGASTFADPLNAPVSGHYHKLPAGTQLPDCIDIIADGSDVLPGSMMPPTHHTIFNTKDMTFGEFTEIFDSLPWQYGGNKKK